MIYVVLICLWIIICIILFSYHYLLEIILDLPIEGSNVFGPAYISLKKLLKYDRKATFKQNVPIGNSIDKIYVTDGTLPRNDNWVVEDSDDDEDDWTYFKNLSNEDPNWYLKKRSILKNPAMLPILVPKPNEETKVLIGNRSIEDTSDLSDSISSLDLEETHNTLKSPLLITGRTLIGGKNAIDQLSGPGQNEINLLKAKKVVANRLHQYHHHHHHYSKSISNSDHIKDYKQISSEDINWSVKDRTKLFETLNLKTTNNDLCHSLTARNLCKLDLKEKNLED